MFLVNFLVEGLPTGNSGAFRENGTKKYQEIMSKNRIIPIKEIIFSMGHTKNKQLWEHTYNTLSHQFVNDKDRK